MEIAMRSKELASGFVKRAAINWKQPLGVYLGGAASGGTVGGALGALGGMALAIPKAIQEDTLRDLFVTGISGATKGGLIGGGVGAGLGALQAPYGASVLDKLRKKDILDKLRKKSMFERLRGSSSKDLEVLYPGLRSSFNGIVKTKGNAAAEQWLNDADLNKFTRHPSVNSVIDGLFTPIGTLIGPLS